MKLFLDLFVFRQTCYWSVLPLLMDLPILKLLNLMGKSITRISWFIHCTMYNVHQGVMYSYSVRMCIVVCIVQFSTSAHTGKDT